MYLCMYVYICIPKNPDDEAENCSVYYMQMNTADNTTTKESEE